MNLPNRLNLASAIPVKPQEDNEHSQVYGNQTTLAARQPTVDLGLNQQENTVAASRNKKNIMKTSPDVLTISPQQPRTLDINRTSPKILNEHLRITTNDTIQRALQAVKANSARSHTNSEGSQQRNRKAKHLDAPKIRDYFRRGRNTEKVDEYSEGESGSEFPVKYKSLKRNRQTQRLVFLWRKAYSRATISARLIYSCYYLHQDLIAIGTFHSLLDRTYSTQLDSQKSKTCLIMPHHKLKGVWTMVIIVLLIYTAIFVPYKIAFVEESGLAVLDVLVDVLFGIDIIINFLSA